MNYEFIMLHHVGVVTKRMCKAAAVHEGDDNNPSGPTGRGLKTPLVSMVYTEIVSALRVKTF